MCRWHQCPKYLVLRTSVHKNQSKMKWYPQILTLVVLGYQHMIKEISSIFFPAINMRTVLSATWWATLKWVKLQFECPSHRRWICFVSLEPEVKGYIIIQMLNLSDQCKEKKTALGLAWHWSIHIFPFIFLTVVRYLMLSM